MDIDLAVLRGVERERDISLDILIPAIEQALLLAYERTGGSYRQARAELDRKTGHVTIWVREEFEVPVEDEPAQIAPSGSADAGGDGDAEAIHGCLEWAERTGEADACAS